MTTATPPQNVNIVPGNLIWDYQPLYGDCYSNLWDPPTPNRSSTYMKHVAHYGHGGVSKN